MLNDKAMENKSEEKQVSLWQIFKVFSKIGLFTIGGGYAMIPLISDEMEKRGWISAEELPNIVALALSAPGVLAVNCSIFTGYRLRGVKGSIVAACGSVMPAFIIILMAAMFMTNFQDNPTVIKIFKGIRPVVVSLIAVPMINMARKSNKSWWGWASTVVTMFLVAFMKVSPIWILMVVISVSLAVSWIRENKKQQ